MNEFDLNIGAQVFCTDGKCGTLAKVAVNPETWQVTHLVVEDGFLLKQSRVFPFSTLERVTAGEIYLAADSTELQNYPIYREEVVERAAPDQGEAGTTAFWREGVPYGVGPAMPMLTVSERVRHGVPDGSVVVEPGMAVEALDGGVGKVHHLRAGAEAGEITQIIVQQGLLFTTQRALPAYMARAISEDGIFVEATVEELKSLPQYKAGDHDAHSVEMNEVNEVSESDNSGRPAANGGNMDLTTRVAQALADDPRTSDAVIEVIDQRGVITLEGQVDDPETREAAQEIAAAQSGVTTVMSHLRIG